MMIKRTHKKNSGAALLVVLFIVMAITVLAFGFLTRSDVELACGQNMELRTAMDYLAESGLQHARGLILNPQDVATGDWYWNGASGQQLVDGSSDYYDVAVTRLDPCTCNYQISSEAYRLKGTEKIGRSSLTAELRLDPCIALWTGGSWRSESQTTINGDIYCGDKLSGSGNIRGDAFAKGDITASNITGSSKPHLTGSPVTLPGLSTFDFSSSYYIGTSNYLVQPLTEPNLSGNYSWSAGNPAGVHYRDGNLVLQGPVNINGMLVVKGNLNVDGTNNVITAVKNFPALLVGGTLTMENGATLEVNGLAQVKSKVDVKDNISFVHVTFNGALLILNTDIDGLSGSSTVNITAAPDKAAIQVWLSPGTPTRWSPAAGAFFRSIRRP